MSILIKGMDMPRTCKECPCYYYEYHECNALVGRYVDGEASPPGDCPLIELQPHGRLIDADELKKENDKRFRALYGEDARTNDLVSYANSWAYLEIKDAPTIIEAEGQE